MKKVLFACTMLLCLHGLCEAQRFHWPRNKAAEVGGGASAEGKMLYASYVYFVQPRQRREKNFTDTSPRNRYTAFPCKKKFRPKIPPGLSVKLSGFYEQGAGKELKYRTLGLDGALLYVIYYNRLLYVHIKVGGTILNDALITPLEEGNTDNDYNRINYGAMAGFEVDYMLNRKRTHSMVVGWDQRRLANAEASWGVSRWYAYVGYRFKVGRR